MCERDGWRQFLYQAVLGRTVEVAEFELRGGLRKWLKSSPRSLTRGHRGKPGYRKAGIAALKDLVDWLENVSPDNVAFARMVNAGAGISHAEMDRLEDDILASVLSYAFYPEAVIFQGHNPEKWLANAAYAVEVNGRKIVATTCVCCGEPL